MPYGVAFTRGVLRGAVAAPPTWRCASASTWSILVVTGSLWRAALEANDGDLAGYDELALLWYIAIAQAAQLGPRPRTIEEVGDEIGSGTVAVQMLRPVSVVGLRIASELGEAMLRVVAAAAGGRRRARAHRRRAPLHRRRAARRCRRRCSAAPCR